MAVAITKILIALCITVTVCSTLLASAAEVNTNYLDVETPTFFNYNSPLRQPGSLRSRPYYDFLSTLYRRDATKSDLFRPYGRSRRAAVAPVLPVLPAVSVAEHIQAAAAVGPPRAKRAIIFRPLFVYKQQQVRRQKLTQRKKRV